MLSCGTLESGVADDGHFYHHGKRRLWHCNVSLLNRCFLHHFYNFGDILDYLNADSFGQKNEKHHHHCVCVDNLDIDNNLTSTRMYLEICCDHKLEHGLSCHCLYNPENSTEWDTCGMSTSTWSLRYRNSCSTLLTVSYKYLKQDTLLWDIQTQQSLEIKDQVQGSTSKDSFGFDLRELTSHFTHFHHNTITKGSINTAPVTD